MVDGGSNVCITGNLGVLLDVKDIAPIQISVMLKNASASFDDCITKRGLLLLTLTDGSCYYQPCYFCAGLVETIVSPSAILTSSNIFVQWQQIGYKDPTVPGSIRFSSHDGLASMHFSLRCHNGLYYVVLTFTRSITCWYTSNAVGLTLLRHRPPRHHVNLHRNLPQHPVPDRLSRRCGLYGLDRPVSNNLMFFHNT
jgi:hypothetical protein